jgi:hypothetical protein
MKLNKGFFNDPEVSQILGELMSIRANRRSWLAVGESHYHDGFGKAQPIDTAPNWLVPVYHPKRGTVNCYKDTLNLSKLYEAGWTYINGELTVTVYSTIDLTQGDRIELKLLEKYLPPLQKFGVSMQVFPFNASLTKANKIIYETKIPYGTRSISVHPDLVVDSIATAWYDRDYKVIIRYSQDLL